MKPVLTYQENSITLHHMPRYTISQGYVSTECRLTFLRRIGRKRVLGLSMIGIILSQVWIITVCWFWRVFPLRLVWAAAMFQVMGGGGTVTQSMVYAITSDISTEANRYS